MSSCWLSSVLPWLIAIGAGGVSCLVVIFGLIKAIALRKDTPRPSALRSNLFCAAYGFGVVTLFWALLGAADLGDQQWCRVLEFQLHFVLLSVAAGIAASLLLFRGLNMKENP